MNTKVPNEGIWISGLMIAAGLLATPQSITAQSWVKTSATNLNWVSLAGSSNGNILVALPSAKTPLPIYLSTNSGATWFTNGLPRDVWGYAAISADGSVMKAAGAYYGSTLWTTTNGGANWWSNAAPAIRPLSCSVDGVCWLLAGTNSIVYLSTNIGVSWTSNSVLSISPRAVASSADGSRLVIAGNNQPSSIGPIFTSADGGATWQSNNVPLRNWTSVAISADGTNLAATAQGAIYVSTNAGAVWTPANVPSYYWSSIAMTANGTKLLAAAHYGFTPQDDGSVRYSTNSGLTWTSVNVPSWYWDLAATSADGSKLAVASGAGSGAAIYVWQALPRLSVALGDTSLRVSWPSMSAANGYHLETSSDLSLAIWNLVALLVSDDGTNRVVTLPLPENNAFYRLKQ